MIIREFEDEPENEPRREEIPLGDEDFDFGLDDEEEDDEGIGSIFDDAGDDEDFVSKDLFGDKDLEEDDDDMSDVDDEFSFKSLFDEEDSEDEGNE